MGEDVRNWDFSLNWRRTDLMVLREKRWTGQLNSCWPITFNITSPFDNFCEHSLVNHLNTYLKLCIRIIPVRSVELFMCLKSDKYSKVRQAEAHNPLNMFSSHLWNLVSENIVTGECTSSHPSCLCPLFSGYQSLASQGGQLWSTVWTSQSTSCWLCSRICCT